MHFNHFYTLARHIWYFSRIKMYFVMPTELHLYVYVCIYVCIYSICAVEHAQSGRCGVQLPFDTPPSTRPTPTSQSENNTQVRISQSENSTAVSGADMVDLTAVTAMRTELFRGDYLMLNMGENKQDTKQFRKKYIKYY